MRILAAQYYDFVFTTSQGQLKSGYYTIDFLEYVKAGVAFNAMGRSRMTRKISAFAEVYLEIENAHNECRLPDKGVVGKFIQYFYQDLYSAYESQVAGSLIKSNKSDAAIAYFQDLEIVPEFISVPWVRELFDVKVVTADTLAGIPIVRKETEVSQQFMDRLGETRAWKLASLYKHYGSFPETIALEVSRD